MRRALHLIANAVAVLLAPTSRCVSRALLLASAATGAALAYPHDPQVDLGQSVFDNAWLPTGTVGGSGRVGLGPLFNAASCAACHFAGGHGQGPSEDGLAPTALVIKLETPTVAASPMKPRPEPEGDPIYGHVLNTSGTQGAAAEATVTIRFTNRVGYYYPMDDGCARTPNPPAMGGGAVTAGILQTCFNACSTSARKSSKFSMPHE